VVSLLTLCRFGQSGGAKKHLQPLLPHVCCSSPHPTAPLPSAMRVNKCTATTPPYPSAQTQPLALRMQKPPPSAHPPDPTLPMRPPPSLSPSPAAPKRVMDQLSGIFPGIGAAPDLLIVPTCQRAETDLVNTGEAADAEKDRLLERFAEWAVAVCGRLSSAGHWCDYIDPCSGLPVRWRGMGGVFWCMGRLGGGLHGVVGASLHGVCMGAAYMGALCMERKRDTATPPATQPCPNQHTHSRTAPNPQPPPPPQPQMMHKESQTPYSEVEGLSVLLGYRTANAGCCKVVLHPKWGTSVYPATLFARAPPAAVEAAIKGAEEQLKAAKA